MFKHKWLFLFVILAVLLASCGAPAQPTVVEAQPTAAAPEATEAMAQPTEAMAQPTEAPTQAPETRKVATFIWTQEFDTLNPYYTNMWFSQVTQQLWLPWPWEFDENNEVFPKLVTEIPSVENGGISEDGTTITMNLRDDVKWSDNEPLTSDDFMFTYEMLLDPNNTVATTYPFDQLASLETPDDHTVVMNFDQPFASWLATFWKGILPAHILRPVFESDGTIDNAEWNLAPTVGLGPYVFSEWESGSFARFVVNDNYWGERPKIDEIFFRFVPDDASQVAALRAGDGDLGTFIAYNDVPSLQDAGLNIVTVASGYNEGWYFLINEERGHPALLDARVRRAIAMAFDRESLSKDLLLGLTGVPSSFWDALPFYNTPEPEIFPYDPEAAKNLLDEAGWVDSNGDGVRDKDGVELVLSYGTTIREIRQDTQAVAQQQLAEVGIQVDLQTYDADIFFSGYGDGGPAATGQVDIMEYSDAPQFPDPDQYYWLCDEIPSDEYPDGGNWQFLCDEELDSLFKLEVTQVDDKARQETFAKINQIFHDQVYWVGLWQDPDLWALGSRLENVKLSGVTPFFDITEWDLNP